MTLAAWSYVAELVAAGKAIATDEVEYGDEPCRNCQTARQPNQAVRETLTTSCAIPLSSQDVSSYRAQYMKPYYSSSGPNAAQAIRDLNAAERSNSRDVMNICLWLRWSTQSETRPWRWRNAAGREASIQAPSLLSSARRGPRKESSNFGSVAPSSPRAENRSRILIICNVVRRKNSESAAPDNRAFLVVAER